jgi:hypothetical protein
MTKKDTGKKVKKASKSPKKAKRDAIIQHISEALGAWKEEWPAKKFESRVKKAAKLFMDGKTPKPKKKGNQKPGQESSNIPSE